MPAAATIDAPPAPAAAPAPPVTIPATPKPGLLRPSPARDKMFKALEDQGKPADAIAPATPDQKPATQPPSKPAAAPEPPKPSDAPKPGDAPAPSTDQPPAEPSTSKMDPKMREAVSGKDGKVNPWKLSEFYKSKFSEAQAEIANLKTSGLAETEKKSYLERIEKAEQRIKLHEDDLRLTNYQKTQEFQDKYQKPYDAAWKRTMGELQGLSVPIEGGEVRPFTPQDMLQLVNADAIPARKLATELYGEFANDVMMHRNEIRRMADEQNAAIQEAKTTGEQREKERTETTIKSQREASDHIRATFKKEYDAAQADPEHGKFFSPKEGDDEWNQALEFGRKLSASVFQKDPQAPGLTPAERAQIVKEHAAVFNRSSAFGPLKRAYMKLEKELATARKELEGFKGSRPDAAGGTQQPANGSAPVKARDRVMDALAKMGRPA